VEKKGKQTDIDNRPESMPLITQLNIGSIKEIGHEEPYYNTKISIFSLTWAGSFPQSNNYIMKVVQYPSTEINVAGFGV
jgi:hypothetical protein